MKSLLPASLASAAAAVIALACSPTSCEPVPEPLEQSNAPIIAFMLTHIVSVRAHDLQQRPIPCAVSFLPRTIAGRPSVTFDWEANEAFFLVEPRQGGGLQLHRWELKTGVVSLVKTTASIMGVSASRGSMSRIERTRSDKSSCSLVYVGVGTTRVLREKVSCFAMTSLHGDDVWLSDETAVIRRLDVRGSRSDVNVGTGYDASVSPNGSQIAYVGTSLAIIVVAEITSAGGMTTRREIPVGGAYVGTYRPSVRWNADSTITVRRVPKNSVFEEGPCSRHECNEFVQIDGDHVRRLARGVAISEVVMQLDAMPCPRLVTQ